VHKILTGCREKFNTLRQHKGISGFPKITESEHDAYGVGHSSTSVSAALGFAKARDLKKEDHEVVAVIGDGAMTGGNALEAINQAGYLNTKVTVVLNDNRMSISPNVGALSDYTHRIQHTDIYKSLRETLAELIEQGNGLKEKLLELKAHIKEVGSPGLLFEKLGFNYIGPVNGHDINSVLNSIKEARNFNGPSLIHCITVKGKGYSFAENEKSKYHGVSAFNVDDGQGIKCAGVPSYTEMFADAAVELAEADKKIVAITAAMPDGTGLSKFRDKFPDRFFDVGIAEQHGVVFAAGLAASGMKPICAIYSSFLQRAYDGIIHDVCLQNLPVVFAVDRAGVVGNDGPTHHGNFDMSYLRNVPNMIIMAPKDENELRNMLHTAISLNRPVAVRYPRGCGRGVSLDKEMKSIELGKAEVLKEGKDILILSAGTMTSRAEEAIKSLESEGIDCALVNTRFIKPLDKELICSMASKIKKVVTIEENTLNGGFGSAVLELLNQEGLYPNVQAQCIGIPDTFIEHASQPILWEKCGLTPENIKKVVLELSKRRL